MLNKLNAIKPIAYYHYFVIIKKIIFRHYSYLEYTSNKEANRYKELLDKYINSYDLKINEIQITKNDLLEINKLISEAKDNTTEEIKELLEYTKLIENYLKK